MAEADEQKVTVLETEPHLISALEDSLFNHPEILLSNIFLLKESYESHRL